MFSSSQSTDRVMLKDFELSIVETWLQDSIAKIMLNYLNPGKAS
jgi:hypothetical protein